MQKHKELREKFGNVLPTDNAVEVLEAIEQWLIERESKALRIHDVVGRSEQCCSPTDGFYLGTTCHHCNKPFRKDIK